MNEIDEALALIAAYRAAHYCVRLNGGRRIMLHIDTACPRAIGDILGRVDEVAAVGALITAWNPFSQPTPRAQNRLRQRELLGCLRAARALVLAGAGIGADWREAGFAVFGLPIEQLDALARRFGQNAILTFQACGPVRLRVYRADWREAAAGADLDFAPNGAGEVTRCCDRRDLDHASHVQLTIRTRPNATAPRATSRRMGNW